MATYAVGDIHGQLEALNDLLGQLRAAVAPGDVVVFLGDYIDRGPDTRGCIDAILAFERQGPADVVCLRGNHEDWMLRTRADYSRHSWLLGMEALETVHSYSAEAARLLRAALAESGLSFYLEREPLPYARFFEAVPEAHHAFFSRLALSFRNADCICTHGGLDPRVPTLAEQRPNALIWGDGSFPEGYSAEPPVVYGHWNNADVDAQGWPGPRVTGNTIGIDTIAHGVLTSIRLPDRRVFQSRRIPGYNHEKAGG